MLTFANSLPACVKRNSNACSFLRRPSHGGGNQTASDGGLGVRVALPAGAQIDGYIPRLQTGFQVKKPEMAHASILVEMRPGGEVRPVISELAHAAGAYVIVSSASSVSDSALRNRRSAMTEALDGVPHAAHLLTDFYDRRRLASWTKSSPRTRCVGS